MKIRKVFIPLIFCVGLIGMISCSNEEGSSPFISTDENQGENVTITLELQGGNVCTEKWYTNVNFSQLPPLATGAH